MIRSVRHDNSTISEFDTSCFSGEYVTGDVSNEYLEALEASRNDRAKAKRHADNGNHPFSSDADTAGAAVAV